MIKKLSMPETLEARDITIIKRNSKYDDEFWHLLKNNSEFLSEYLNWPKRITTRRLLSKETKKELKKWKSGEKFYYYLLDANNKFVGAVYVLNIDYKHHSAEFGYWLCPKETGKGYISLAVKELEKFLFNQDIVRIVIRCDVENIASARVADRNGYNFEGVLKRSFCNDGRFVDNRLYAKINPNFKWG